VAGYQNSFSHWLCVFSICLGFFYPVKTSYAFASNNGSKRAFKQALENYYQKKYQESYRFALKSVEYDSTNVSAYRLISDLCIELKLPEKRIWSLEKLVQLNEKGNIQALKYLGKDYFKMGNYDLAKERFERYLSSKQSDSIEVLSCIERCNQCSNMVLHSKKIDIFHLDTTINTIANEYWPAISVDDSTLYFTRLMKDKEGRLFERIFFSSQINSSWGDEQELVLSGDGLINEGTMCFSANNKLLFFTACEREDGFGSCDIYYSQNINGMWVRPLNAGSKINSSNWEAQPSISADGTVLYFSSNRKGGFGKNDIWKANISKGKDGEMLFSTPENLGASINTSENDYSPFIHADDKTLYFASTGRITLGGADLFFSRKSDSVWVEAENLGYPINSRFEDDGLVVSATAQVAVFSSDRESSVNGSKDLYQFRLPQEIAPQKVGYIKGFIFDADNHDRLDADIEFVELSTGKTQKIHSSPIIGYTLLINANSTYALTINEEKYLMYSQHFSLDDTRSFNQGKQLNFYLTPIKIGQKAVLNNVFFDFDSYTLKPESTAELMQLINFLKSNLKIKIEVAGHTDNVGNEIYNQSLSEKRAKAIADFLMTRIASDRISYKGYGSGQPVVSNDTELGRMKNRRSEFRILSY
jgi:outer membrane protein OmpA-like peptidoglycan-associated protein/tetratricopeptide (TPR) repeat protein